MNITVTQEGPHTSFAIVGSLDINSASQLEEFADKLYGQGVKDIDVDMSGCAYVSSAGLRVIVAMRKRVADDGSLVFRKVQPEVMEVFQITGFDKILTIE